MLILVALVAIAALAFALSQCEADPPDDATDTTVTQPQTTAKQSSTTTESTVTTIQPDTNAQEVAVTRGDLVISDTVDGTLEETGTIDVVHRIDDQLPATPTTASAASGAIATASAKRFAELVKSTPGAPPIRPTEAHTQTVAARESATTPSVSPSVSTTTSSTTTTSTTAAPRPANATTTTLVYPAPTTTTLVFPAPTTSTTIDPTSTSTTTTTTCPPQTTSAPPAHKKPGGSSSGGSSNGASGSTGDAAVSGATTTTIDAGATDAGVTQTVEGIVPVGQIVKSGDVLYTVDGQPVIALTGILPASRTLEAGIADGPDIAQLEEALVALGFDPDRTVTVDEEWTGDTTAMVERWQKANEVDVTGIVELGTVVFIDHSATVSEVLVTDGAAIADGTKVMSLSGTAQLITIAVPSELQGLLTIGSEVTVDGVAATITDLRSAQNADGPKNIQVQALITPSKPIDAKPGATVKVEIEQTVATDELLVPSDAIVSRRDGTYAVQVPSDGDAEYVTVIIIGTVGTQTAVASDDLDEQSKVLTNK